MSASRLFLSAVTVLLVALPFNGYEDLTHQALTRQAVEIAKKQGQGIGELAAYEQVIIDGSGKGPDPGHDPDKTDGEDYTKYKIEWSKCPDPVTPKVNRPLKIVG